MQKPIFYPRLSKPDLHLFRIAGPGLGNLLFPWARANVLAKRWNGDLISPTWRNIKIGPLIRRERDLRFYSNIFKHRSAKKLTTDLFSKAIFTNRITEEEFLKNPHAKLVLIEGEGNYFEDLTGTSDFLRSELRKIARHQVLDAPNGIAMHIRMGDFQDTGKEIYARNSRVSLQWFTMEAVRLRKLLGPLDITIFTDDTTGAVSNAFSQIDRVYFAHQGNAIEDILKIANARHIVCSNSTFSLWATFLSDSTFSARFPELFEDYRFAPEITKRRLIAN